MQIPLLLQAASTVTDSAKSKEIVFNLSNAIEKDIHGNGNSLVITLIGITVVYIALIFIYWIFLGLTKLIKITEDRKRSMGKDALTSASKTDDLNVEVNAAIAMALHLYFQQIHDHESTVLTISKVSKTYSPWSSKIYGLRRHPKIW